MDIDGVLNVFSNDETLVEGIAGKYDVRYRPEYASALTQLSLVYDIVWASAWQDSAPELFAPLFGWGHDIPWIDFDLHSAVSPRVHWKLPGVVDFVQDRPVVWVDDEGNNQSIRQWAQSRNESIPTKIIVPWDDEGLTWEHLMSIAYFATSFVPQAEAM
jgi:hypothetical protein